MDCVFPTRVSSALGTCGGESKGDPLFPDLKGRQRLDSASTMAPGSSSLSFTSSPMMSPGLTSLLDATEPVLNSNHNFMLPAAEMSDDEERSNDPVSRVTSPAHKVPRLGGTNEPVGSVAVAVETPGALPATPLPESPRTPRTMVARTSTPPPLIPKSRIPRPPMLQALQSKSVEQVRAVLLENPEAAHEPFWDHDVEPPLCCAMRLQCNTAILQLLLDYGASPETKNARGRTPAEIVWQRQPWETEPPMSYELTWAHVSPGLPPFFPQVFDGLPTYGNSCESWRHDVTQLLKA